MTRRQKDLLRELTAEERRELLQFSRSQAAPAVEVTQARLLLLGVVGSVMVSLGWLGASAVERGLHGSPADFAPITALVTVQAAIELLALAPSGCLRPKRA